MSSPKQGSQSLSQISHNKRLKRQYGHYSCHNHLGDVNTSVIHTNQISVNVSDDVLDHIFSFLPIKNAMQIGVLSTRFKNAWIFSRRLYFDKDFSRGRSREEFISIVDKVFDLHAGSSILSFRLCFDPNGEELLVGKWIKKSFEKGVEELDLDFSRRGYLFEGFGPCRLPSDVFDVESLKVLKLTFCQLDVPPKLKGLKFLDTLILRKINLAPTLIFTLFQHCLLLETLDLAHCHRIFHLKISAQNLKVLKVGDCQDIATIDIDAPTLQSLHYCGHLCIIKLANVQQLKDVMINFRPSKGFTETFQVRNLVYDLYHAHVLTTTSTFLEGLCPKLVNGTMTEMQFFFWNLKEFHLLMEGAIYCNPFDIVSFLKSCPCLEKIFIDLNDFCFVGGLYWELHHRQAFDQCRISFNCLKFIKLTGFKFQKYELLLVKFLLERAFHLEKLVLVTPRSRRAKVFTPDLHFYYQYLQSWKASPGAQIAVYEHLSDWSSVCPTHSKIWY